VLQFSLPLLITRIPIRCDLLVDRWRQGLYVLWFITLWWWHNMSYFLQSSSINVSVYMWVCGEGKNLIDTLFQGSSAGSKRWSAYRINHHQKQSQNLQAFFHYHSFFPFFYFIVYVHDCKLLSMENLSASFFGRW
jgi:hypothetical protein